MSDACRHKKHHERDFAIAGDCQHCDNYLEAHCAFPYDILSIYDEIRHIGRKHLRAPVRRRMARSPTILTMPSSAASNAGQSCRSSVVAEVTCDVAHDNVQVSVVS